MNATFLRAAVLAGGFFLSAPPILAQIPKDSAGVPALSFAPAPKSGTAATLLGILPGLGHFYAGEYRTGAVLMALFGGAIAVGAGGENSTSGLAAFLISGVPWWYSFIDAHNAAARYNRAHFGNPSTAQVRPVLVSANRTLQIGIGVSVTY